MKKIPFLIILCCLTLTKLSYAQIESFSQKLDKAFEINLSNDEVTKIIGSKNIDEIKKALKAKIDSLYDSLEYKSNTALKSANYNEAKKKVNAIRSLYLDSINTYKTLYYYANNVNKVNLHLKGDDKLFKRDGLYKRKFQLRKYAYEAIDFFENDSVHLKFFKNNTVNYAPATRQMSLYTEVLNDYFAAFRVGIGFQVKTNPVSDSTIVSDSAKKVYQKNDLVGNLQNQAGGDFNINVAYPLIKNRSELAWVNYRIYAYGNVGVSLPFLNKSTSDFILNSDIGLQGSLYSNGFNGNISIFSHFKVAHYFGNSKYRKILTEADAKNPTSFWLTKTSIGLAFMDGYRISFDLYPHFGNKFIKDNFPATISFTIRPSSNKK